jgi:4'-phosphopantetheinyl transferase
MWGAGSIEWIDAQAMASLAPAGKSVARALVCDLADPALTRFLALAPSASDLADEARPSASERSLFFPRRALLRTLVAACAGVAPADVAIGYDPDGAPRVLAPQGFFVSASGRGALAALACARMPVGVDLEPPGDAPAVDAILHPRERAALAASATPALDFLKIWTAKEAYLKALGRGFKRDPARAAVLAGRGRAFTVEDDGFPAAIAAAEWAPPFARLPALVAACATLRP